jgi:hypothetical protein
LNETLASLVPIGTSVPRAQSPQTHKKKQISKPISKTASVTRHPKFSRNQSTTKSQPEQTKAQEHARPAKENKSIGLSPNSTDGPHGQDRKEFTRATKEVAKKLAISDPASGGRFWSNDDPGGCVSSQARRGRGLQRHCFSQWCDNEAGVKGARGSTDGVNRADPSNRQGRRIEWGGVKRCRLERRGRRE